MPRAKKDTIHKSAKDGKIVSEAFAEANPDTTFEQKVEKPKKVMRVPLGETWTTGFIIPPDTCLQGSYYPSVGEIARFIKGDEVFLAEIQQESPLELVKHDIINHVRRTELMDVHSLEGYVIEPVSRTEIFELLY